MKKILIVEDDVLLNHTLGYNLASDGYDVTSAYHCKDAVHYLKETEFDAALLDINLPYQDGFRFAEKSGRNPIFQSLCLPAETAILTS